MSDTPTIQQWADTPVDAAIAAGPQADSDTQAPAMPALAGSPAPDLSSPPVLPNPQSPGSPQEQQTDAELSGPQAPAGGSGSMWEKILMGALSGLAGQRQHGRSSVVNGIIGGAQGEQAAQQQQQENDRANTELQSNIKFRNMQSALALATSARQDKELEMSTQEHNDAHDANSRATIDWLQSHGVEGDIIPNTHESATNALQNANASSPEGVNVPVGIIHGSNFIFIPKNDTQDVDDEHKQVSDLSSAMGMPAPSRSQFGSMSQDQRDSMRNGLLQMSRGYDRTGGLIPAAQLPQQITLAKSALTAYQTSPNADAQTVKLMQTRIANMQQQSDDIDAHLTSQKAADAKATAQAELPYKLAQAKAEQVLKDGSPIEAASLLVNGDIAPSQIISSRQPAFAQQAFSAARDLAKQQGKDWNPQQAEGYFKVASAPTNVQFFGSANSLLDKGGTLDQLQSAYNALPNGKIPAVNKAVDWSTKQVGGKSPTGFQATAIGLADDYAKVMGGGQGTDSARNEILNSIMAAQSPDQMKQTLMNMRAAVTSQVNARIGTNPVLRRMYGQNLPETQPAGAGTNQSQNQSSNSSVPGLVIH